MLTQCSFALFPQGWQHDGRASKAPGITAFLQQEIACRQVDLAIKFDLALGVRIGVGADADDGVAGDELKSHLAGHARREGSAGAGGEGECVVGSAARRVGIDGREVDRVGTDGEVGDQVARRIEAAVGQRREGEDVGAVAAGERVPALAAGERVAVEAAVEDVGAAAAAKLVGARPA